MKETLKRKISSYLCRLLGLPHSLKHSFVWETTNLRLRFSSLDEELRVSWTREVMLYQDSKDSKVASGGIMLLTSRRRRAQADLDKVESRLRHRALMGTVATGRVWSFSSASLQEGTWQGQMPNIPEGGVGRSQGTV